MSVLLVYVAMFFVLGAGTGYFTCRIFQPRNPKNGRCVKCQGLTRSEDATWCEQCSQKWIAEAYRPRVDMIGRLSKWQKEQQASLVVRIALDAEEFDRQIAELELRHRRAGRRLKKGPK